MVKEAHPFSVASAPKDSPRKVTFMVHRLGDFTRQVNKIFRRWCSCSSEIENVISVRKQRIRFCLHKQCKWNLIFSDHNSLISYLI
ncbi:hypothetical protein [Limosilactobacillus portuensis]|uniref:hypothetical protein n=1 Tax=Limosilactobacillus TaxID=2742598 RepID=UPI002DD7883B|nr:hypothetical protein [Limosilactobacillus sp. c10Ua_36]